jgi:hypothetical protein
MHELFQLRAGRTISGPAAREDAVPRGSGDAWRQRWPEVLPGPLQIIPTLGDAVGRDAMLEHALRPFSHRPVQADVIHAVTNGLGVLPAVAS